MSQLFAWKATIHWACWTSGRYLLLPLRKCLSFVVCPNFAVHLTFSIPLIPLSYQLAALILLVVKFPFDFPTSDEFKLG